MMSFKEKGRKVPFPMERRWDYNRIKGSEPTLAESIEDHSKQKSNSVVVMNAVGGGGAGRKKPTSTHKSKMESWT